MTPGTDIDHQAAELFELALNQAMDRRQSFVIEQSQGQPELADMVLELLKCHGQTMGQDFLLDRPLQPLQASEPNADCVAIAESEGDTIGRYKLLEKIGEGGMGVVYMAQQTSDVQRRVAIKIIKLGMDTRQVVSRFESERRAMAIFEHPGITRLLDAGTTESGRPYYVMELVKGRNVVEFATTHRLSIEQRLKLMVEICHAFQHAHLKGIIHRDIKPSNILVGMIDGKPAPKVIDFGIAKALQPGMMGGTYVTRHSSFVGTPQYMSPEQAESSGVDVDTRSDIYGLGVLLYELVTGTTPLCRKEISELNPLALLETIRNQNIETPSTRISKLNADDTSRSDEIAPRRPAEGDLPRELDWIVMKSLARERDRRYQSASEMAEDIERFLSGELVEAAPPGRSYRMKTHVRKHLKTYTLAAIGGSVILASAVSSLIFGYQAHVARAEQELALAEVQTKNQQLEDKNQELIESKRVIEKHNLDTRYRKVLDITAAKSQYQQMADWSGRLLRQFDPTRVNEDAALAGSPKVTTVTTELSPVYDFSDLYKSLSAPLREVLKEQVEPILKIDREAIQFRRELDAKFADSSGAKLGSETMEIKFFSGSTTLDVNTLDDSLLKNGSLVLKSNIGSQIVLGGGKAFDTIAPDMATKYFRLLVQEFRLEFGELNPRVSMGLNLLAAALIQEQKFDEASATLRESISLARDDQSRKSARLLLEQCR